MAEALDDYTATWNEFKLRSDEKQKTADFLNRLKSHDLSQITSMLSIGAGWSSVDVERGGSQCSGTSAVLFWVGQGSENHQKTGVLCFLLVRFVGKLQRCITQLQSL